MIEPHTLAALQRLHDRVDHVCVKAEAMHVLIVEVLEKVQALHTIQVFLGDMPNEETQSAQESESATEDSEMPTTQEDESQHSVQTWP